MDAKQITNDVRAYFAQENMTMAQVAERLGVTPPAVTNQLSGRPFSAKMARRYADEFGFSFDYLLNGAGRLLDTDDTGSGHTVPLFPFSVRAGVSLNDITEGMTDDQCERITSPVRGAELAIEVVGDSMAPAFPAGARVLLRRVPADTFITWGEVFVVDTVNGPMLKRIMPTEDEHVWEMRSDNPAYPPFQVKTEHVRSVWRVLLRMIQ